MKNLMKALGMVVGAGLLLKTTIAVAASDSEGAQKFRFNFELNQPLLFSVQSDVKTLTDRTMQLDTGNKSSLTKNSIETRYKVKLTPVRKSKDGTWTVHYEPMEMEQDMDVTGNGAHLVTEIRGLAVKSTQNGIVVVDTAKGIGVQQAKSMKQAAYPRMLSGYLDFKPDGTVAKIDGDLPFIDFWTDAIRYQVGFFDIQFPASAVPPGGSWTENLTLKDLEGLKLGDEGVTITNEFVRQGTAAADSNHMDSIAVSAAFNGRDIMGSMDTMGQNTMLNISRFDVNKSGQYQFDRAAGRLLNGNEDETFKMSADMLVQGHTASVTTDMQMTSKFELLKN